ncbi:MAG: hypothetical protein WB439_03260 [Acidobacteriaceae bacterium]
MLYMWGQIDKAKVYRRQERRFDETPVMMRDVANQGPPGAMVSLSANGNKDGILWAAIHAIGSSWHESHPGILHAYDADDIRDELWNSLQNPGRDDCGEYSKMAPPTIANGRVYLASFGTENVGTGQFCVFGLLPRDNAAKLSAPTRVKEVVLHGSLTLSWNPVPGARLYRVFRTSTLEPAGKTVALRPTTPEFTEPAPEKVDSASYTVLAVGVDGVSAMSEAAKVMSPEHT